MYSPIDTSIVKNSGCRSLIEIVLQQVTLLFATCLSWQLVKVLFTIYFICSLYVCTYIYIELVDVYVHDFCIFFTSKWASNSD